MLHTAVHVSIWLLTSVCRLRGFFFTNFIPPVLRSLQNSYTHIIIPFNIPVFQKNPTYEKLPVKCDHQDFKRSDQNQCQETHISWQLFILQCERTKALLTGKNTWTLVWCNGGLPTRGHCSPHPLPPGRRGGWCAGDKSAWTRSGPEWRLKVKKTQQLFFLLDHLEGFLYLSSFNHPYTYRYLTMHIVLLSRFSDICLWLMYWLMYFTEIL